MIRVQITHLARPATSTPTTSITGRQVSPTPAKPADAVVTFTRAGAGAGTTIVMDSDQPLVHRAGLIPPWLTVGAVVGANVVSVSQLQPTQYLLTFDAALTAGTSSIVVTQRSPAFKTARGAYVRAGTYLIAAGP